MDGVIKVYCLGWDTDQAQEKGGGHNAMIHSRILVDGHELTCASKIEATAQGGDFPSAVIHLNVNELHFIALDDEQWKLEDLSTLEGVTP